MCPYNMNDAGIQYSTEPSCLQIYLKKQNKTSKPIHCGHILCF